MTNRPALLAHGKFTSPFAIENPQCESPTLKPIQNDPTHLTSSRIQDFFRRSYRKVGNLQRKSIVPSSSAAMSLMEKAMKQSALHFSIPIPYSVYPRQFSVRPSTISTNAANQTKMVNGGALILCCYDSNSNASSSSSSNPAVAATITTAPPVIKRRKRYRKQYPGESKGITEEMRFIAMRLRNINGKKHTHNKSEDDKDEDDNKEDNVNQQDSTSNEFEEGGKGKSNSDGDEDVCDDGGSETWQPSMEGFLKYLVDSEVVFNTVERIVDDSNDVAFAYFRKTGLERSNRLSRDIEWFREKGMEIPEPSSPGVSYAKYLEELAEKSAPQFLCHFYNIYFSHVAGGQVITRQVSDKLLDGKELEFNRWEGDVEELMKGLREKLNMLGEHWSRDEKNKCLREATKSFRFLGQIVRLIIL